MLKIFIFVADDNNGMILLVRNIKASKLCGHASDVRVWVESSMLANCLLMGRGRHPMQGRQIRPRPVVPIAVKCGSRDRLGSPLQRRLNWQLLLLLFHV